MKFLINPMNERWSANRKIALILYLVFLVASVWASGESLSRSLNIPSTFAYMLAFAAVATASFCLNLVKKSQAMGYVSKRFLKLFFGGLGFVILWFAILAANTHNIYFMMTIGGLRQKELREVKTQLELVQDKSTASFGSAKTKWKNRIEGEIKNMKDEFQNPNNPGVGAVTDSIVNRIESLLGQEVDLLTNQPADLYGRRKYAGMMADKIREIAKGRLNEIDTKIDQLETFLNKEEYKEVLNKLDNLIMDFELKTDQELTHGLRNGYSAYNKCQEFVEQLSSELDEEVEFSVKSLPEVPISVEMRDIAFSWGEFFKDNGAIDTARFWWSIFIALILDLACFLFWYFGVLPEEE